MLQIKTWLTSFQKWRWWNWWTNTRISLTYWVSVPKMVSDLISGWEVENTVGIAGRERMLGRQKIEKGWLSWNEAELIGGKLGIATLGSDRMPNLNMGSQWEHILETFFNTITLCNYRSSLCDCGICCQGEFAGVSASPPTSDTWLHIWYYQDARGAAFLQRLGFLCLPSSPWHGVPGVQAGKRDLAR